MHIIEELVLFAEPQPVQHIELDPQRVNNTAEPNENAVNSYMSVRASEVLFKSVHVECFNHFKPAADTFPLQGPFHSVSCKLALCVEDRVHYTLWHFTHCLISFSFLFSCYYYIK